MTSYQFGYPAPDPPLSLPSTAAAPPTTTSRAAEDDQQQEGISIDTFTDYQPTALPAELIQLCNRHHHHHHKVNNDNNTNNDSSKKSIIHTLEKENAVALTGGDAVDDKDTTTPSSPSTSLSSLPQQQQQQHLTIPSHTSLACESALLSSVKAPPLSMDTAECLLPLLQPQQQHQSSSSSSSSSSLPLSPLQLEGVLLAIQRHRRVHHVSSSSSSSSPSSTATTTATMRAGFFLGDGAGIGKGRQISAILRDSCCRGRTRHVWISVSRELVQDAKRDLHDVGVHINVHDGTSFLGDKTAPGLGRTERGCLFLTYNLLVSTSRLEQIIAWLAGTEHVKKETDRWAAEQAFGGLIVFDEAHKAKNLLQNTKTAQLVLQLQRRLPNARVVYASATGVSDIAQLAYAERLGLWKTESSSSSNGTTTPTTTTTIDIDATNDGTQFDTFKSFQQSLEQRGLGSMELLALELKTRGSFLARTLSWEGAEFQTEEVVLDRPQRLVYDRCVAFFLKLKDGIDMAFHTMGDGLPGSFKSQTWRTYWAAHQRFFKELAICAKVPFIAKDALKQIQKHGNCVVIGLQSTGDAGMQSLLDDGSSKKKNYALSEEERFPFLVSTVSAGLSRFVEMHYPTAKPKPEPPKLPPILPTTNEGVIQYRMIQEEIARIEAMPPPPPNPLLIKLQQELMREIPTLGLPPNPLDDLIDRLGGVDQVAEMTGRPGRVVRVTKDKGGHFVYSRRILKEKTASMDDTADRINLVERRQFMDGTKSVAIISDAASTGISLHAANGSGTSHKRRVHYTIELPWSADKAVQQLGRSHRSGQKSAPIYKLVVTSLGGERRFAAAVSKRLASLGALTKGDRRAATGSDMSSFDLDSVYGKRALKRLYLKLQAVESSGMEQPLSASFLPAKNAGEVIDEFIAEMKATDDPTSRYLTVQKAERKEDQDKEKWKIQVVVLGMCLEELDKVGLDGDARSKAEVKAFLNRLAGISVSRQALVFSLFMATLDDVIKEAKNSGEYEGTAEDITATHIEIGKEEVLAIDPSSGVPTKMTTMLMDRGISFELACNMALEESRKLESDAILKPDNEESALDDISDDGSLEQEELEIDYGNKKNQDTVKTVEEVESNENRTVKKSWPKTKPSGRASPGFYISKKKIAGRHLILLAQGKFDYTTFKTIEEAIGFDPLRWMQISRPNSGTNTADMSSKELLRKYYLACPCDVLKDVIEDPSKSSVEIVRNTKKMVEQMWEEAFKASYNFQNANGLAPRRAKVALVNGPVLHILPALEKSVMFRTAKDKSLKIMRAQIGGRRIVGVRFPHDDDANQKLQEELEKIRKARLNAGKSYTDEPLEPLCPKSHQWATTERKTITSFFKVASSSSSSTSKINNSTNTKSTRLPAKRSSSLTPSSSSAKKTKKMTSFFSKKVEETKPAATAEEMIDLTVDD